MRERILDETITLDPDKDTVPMAFIKRVRKSGPRVALRKKDFGIWQSTTWNEYFEKVKYVSAALTYLNLKKGEKVSLISENRPEWVFIDLGIICAGGLTVPIYTTDSPNQVEYILNHSDSVMYFAEDEEQYDKFLTVREKCPKIRKIIVIDMEGLRDVNDTMLMSFDEFLEIGRTKYEERPQTFEEKVNESKPEDVITFVYTSGTTGPPKAAMLTNRNNIWSMEYSFPDHPTYASDDILSFLPLSHVGQRTFTIFGGLKYGCTSHFVEDLDTVWRDMREVEPQVIFMVPRMWEKLVAQISMAVDDAVWLDRIVYEWAMNVGARVSEKRLEGMKVPFWDWLQYNMAKILVYRPLKQFIGLSRGREVLSGGAPISPEILKYFQAVDIDIWESYGLTESTGNATSPGRNVNKIGRVGKGNKYCEVKIAEDGEILIRGGLVFKGYYKDPEHTNEVIRDGYLYTGDLGSLDEDGYLTVNGRKKHIIITSGGKNISSELIENELKFSTYILDAVVIGDGRKYLTALIVLDEETIVKYAQDQRIPFTTYSSLTQNKQVEKLISKEVDKVNKRLSRVESIKKFKILDEKLRDEDETLTPTLKVKRTKIMERYKDLIEAMY